MSTVIVTISIQNIVSFDSALELALKLKCAKIAEFLLDNGANGSNKEETSVASLILNCLMAR